MYSLMCAFEVKKYSTAGSSYQSDNINLVKEFIERDFFIECIGEDFYNLLLKDSRSFEDATEWRQGVTYSSGDLVIYNGEILESETGLNTTEPVIPLTKWRIATKFKKPAYNAIWEKHLRYIIANKIYKECLPYDTIRSGAKGLTVQLQDQSGIMAAPKSDIQFILAHVQKHIDIQVDAFKKYVINQNDAYKTDKTKGYDFSLIKFVEDCSECVTPGKTNRRTGFLN